MEDHYRAEEEEHKDEKECILKQLMPPLEHMVLYKGDKRLYITGNKIIRGIVTCRLLVIDRNFPIELVS